MDGPKVPLLSWGPEKRATEGEIIYSEIGSLVDVWRGKGRKSGRFYVLKLLIIKTLLDGGERGIRTPDRAFDPITV